jgi:hypothetical protein
MTARPTKANDRAFAAGLVKAWSIAAQRRGLVETINSVILQFANFAIRQFANVD